MGKLNEQRDVSCWPDEGSPRDTWVAQHMLSIHHSRRLRHALQHMALHSIKVHFKRKRRQGKKKDLADGAGDGHAAVEAGAGLLESCRSGNLRQVQRLVDEGVDVNWQHPVSRETPLAAACAAGHFDCVQLLLASQANSCLHDKDDVSPLMRAAQGGKPDIIQLLLAHSRSDTHHTSSVSGRSTLLEAAAAGSCPCIALLVHAGGADPNAANPLDGDHPLLTAASSGHLRAVKLLLSLGAKVNRADSSGNVAVLAAARNGDTAMVRCLLDKGAETVVAEQVGGWTPLMAAASRGAVDTVQALLQARDAAGALAAVDSRGRTAAQLCGRPGLRLLLEASWHMAQHEQPNKSQGLPT